MKFQHKSQAFKIALLGLAAIAASMFSGCGSKTYKGLDGAKGSSGSSCTATQESGGIKVTCTDGSGGFAANGSNGIDGAPGAAGANGANGSNGHSAALSVIPADNTVCSNSTADTSGYYGQVISMGIDLNDNHSLEVGETQQVAVLCNGAKGDTGDKGDKGDTGDQGDQGDKGDKGDSGDKGDTGDKGDKGDKGDQGDTGASAPVTSFTPVGLVDPCGPQSAQDEVFIRFSNGSLIASFSENANGKNTRFSVIKDGVGYQTTDDTGCVFSLSTLGTTRTITTNNGVNASWQVTP